MKIQNRATNRSKLAPLILAALIIAQIGRVDAADQPPTAVKILELQAEILSVQSRLSQIEQPRDSKAVAKLQTEISELRVQLDRRNDDPKPQPLVDALGQRIDARLATISAEIETLRLSQADQRRESAAASTLRGDLNLLLTDTQALKDANATLAETHKSQIEQLRTSQRTESQAAARDVETRINAQMQAQNQVQSDQLRSAVESQLQALRDAEARLTSRIQEQNQAQAAQLHSSVESQLLALREIETRLVSRLQEQSQTQVTQLLSLDDAAQQREADLRAQLTQEHQQALREVEARTAAQLAEVRQAASAHQTAADSKLAAIAATIAGMETSLSRLERQVTVFNNEPLVRKVDIQQITQIVEGLRVEMMRLKAARAP